VSPIATRFTAPWPSMRLRVSSPPASALLAPRLPLSMRVRAATPRRGPRRHSPRFVCILLLCRPKRGGRKKVAGKEVRGGRARCEGSKHREMAKGERQH
jgi:hypothetical protein